MFHRTIHGRKERGAVLVELAMVVPILVLVVMGIVDYGVMFSEKISLRNGVRESDWNASCAIYGSEVPCTLTFDGAEPNDTTKRALCLAKYRSELPHEPMRLKLLFVDLDNPGSASSYDVGQGLMVCAMRPARSATKFYAPLFDGKVQQTRLTSVIIATSTEPLQETEEAPIVGQDWSWCDPTKDPPS